MPTYEILTLNPSAGIGLRRFPDARYRVGNTVERPDAILVRSRALHAMPIPSTVLAISRAGAGTNNIPVSAMSSRGAPVFNAPGANANAVKELVLTALLLAARNIVPAVGYVASLDSAAPDLDERVESGKKQFAGIELPGRTLGIVGLGAIGSLVADTAIKLGMNVIGFDPEITVDAAWRLPSNVRKAHSIEELLKQSDFVTLHVPLLDVTRRLVNAERLSVMKPDASLLNFARDAVVDEAAVIAALRARRLKYYLCDFPSANLMREPNVVMLPHLGASTEEAEQNCAIIAVEQLRAFLEDGTIANAVNFPNMLGQISTAMARSGLNIHNMVNKSRGEMAYTLVDVDSAIPDALIESIAAIDGVLSVRAIPVETAD